MVHHRTSGRNILTRSLAVMALLGIYGFSSIGASALLLGASTTRPLPVVPAFMAVGFRGVSLALGAVWVSVYPNYGYGGYYPYYGDLGVCYEVRQRVLKPYGWRVRRISICE